jgi:flagellar FliL protein
MTQGRENRTTTGGKAPLAPAKGGAPATDEEKTKAKIKRPSKALFKSKKFLIAVVGVLVLGGGAYKFAVPHPPAPPTGGDVVAVDPMTVNLAGGHYLKIAISVQLVKRKATAGDFDTSHASELVIDEFSNRSMDAVEAGGKRQKLIKALRDSIKKAYPGKVYDVFLTQYVGQ